MLRISDFCSWQVKLPQTRRLAHAEPKRLLGFGPEPLIFTFRFALITAATVILPSSSARTILWTGTWKGWPRSWPRSTNRSRFIRYLLAGEHRPTWTARGWNYS